MISHGFVSAAMFFCIGVMYDRVHSRKIADHGGVANRSARPSPFYGAVRDGEPGLPGTSGFVGEFMVVILGAVQVNFWYAALAATTLIFGAAYTLWMVKRVIFGAVGNAQVAELKRRERARIPGAGGAGAGRVAWASTRASSATRCTSRSTT